MQYNPMNSDIKNVNPHLILGSTHKGANKT
jgi:hypothetical protein